MKVVQFIKDVSCPIRHFFSSSAAKAVWKNVHSYSELDSRKLLYDPLNIDFESKKSHVIYTCITGDYDFLIQPTFYNAEYDYICFTDNEEWIEKKVIGVWQIRSLLENKFSNALNNRWHKTHPHELFPDYEDSIYIDGNIDVLDDYLFLEIDKKAASKIIIPNHSTTFDIYKEINNCVLCKKITKQQAKNIRNFLKENHYPKHYGMNENNVIYRKHNDNEIIKMMEDWWEFIENVVPRDQLSLGYVLFKNGFTPKEISMPNIRLMPEHFSLYFSKRHRK